MVKLRNAPQLNMVTFYSTQPSSCHDWDPALRQANRQLIPEVSCEARSKVQTLHLGWWTHRWWWDFFRVWGWRGENVWQEWLWYDWTCYKDATDQTWGTKKIFFMFPPTCHIVWRSADQSVNGYLVAYPAIRCRDYHERESALKLGLATKRPKQEKPLRKPHILR